jgi:hypothetical protein
MVVDRIMENRCGELESFGEGIYSFFWWYWGLNLGPYACYVGALPFGPLLQPYSLFNIYR